MRILDRARFHISTTREKKEHNGSNKSRTHIPSVLGRVVVHDGPNDHDLRAAPLQQGLLILLAHLVEGADLLGHTDDPLHSQAGQVDHTNQAVWTVDVSLIK